jgi:hypothetical protein
MTDDERFDARIREAAAAYHQPPETPRDEMWRRIQAERLQRTPPMSRRRASRGRWIGWAAGVAALLAVGIAIGRVTVRGNPPAVPVAVQPGGGEGGDGSTLAYQVSASEHLDRVETFLSGFQSDVRSGRIAEADVGGVVRQLLVKTRLLRGSPAADDFTVRALLDDIDLVLTQIARYADDRDTTELEYIEQGINQRGVLLKLRSAVPAVTRAAAHEGAL